MCLIAVRRFGVRSVRNRESRSSGTIITAASIRPASNSALRCKTSTASISLRPETWTSTPTLAPRALLLLQSTPPTGFLVQPPTAPNAASIVFRKPCVPFACFRPSISNAKPVKAAVASATRSLRPSLRIFSAKPLESRVSDIIGTTPPGLANVRVLNDIIVAMMLKVIIA